MNFQIRSIIMNEERRIRKEKQDGTYVNRQLEQEIHLIESNARKTYEKQDYSIGKF
jgi:hypothetical protein